MWKNTGEFFFDSYGGLWQVASGYEPENFQLRAFGPRGIAYEVRAHWSAFAPEDREEGEDGWWYLRQSETRLFFRDYSSYRVFVAANLEALQAMGTWDVTEVLSEDGQRRGFWVDIKKSEVG